MGTKLLALPLSLMMVTGCMTSEERYKLHKMELEKKYAQQRTYQPFTVEAENGIALQGKTRFTVNVPLDSLKETPIPNDLKTVADLLKWGIGAGLIGYGIHEAGNASGDTVINNNAPAGN